MAGKIMVICCSPRKNGNTHTVAEWFADTARAEGAEVEIVDAARLKYKQPGCIACMGCQKSDAFECVIEDEASAVVAKMPTFDAIVWATPIYWLGPSAQMKMLLDRTFALIKIDTATGEATLAAPNQQLCLIATAGGGTEDGLELLDATLRKGAELFKASYHSLLVPSAPMDPKDMAGRADIKEKAQALAKRVVSA